MRTKQTKPRGNGQLRAMRTKQTKPRGNGQLRAMRTKQTTCRFHISRKRFTYRLTSVISCHFVRSGLIDLLLVTCNPVLPVRSGLIDLLLVTCNPVLPASGSSRRRLNQHPHHFSQGRLCGGWLDTQMEIRTRSVKGCRFWKASGGHLGIITVVLQLPFFGNGFRSKPRGKIRSWSPYGNLLLHSASF